MEILYSAAAALGDAWMLILDPKALAYLAIGVLLGLSVGVFPGLGGIAGLSLMLPFMFGLEPIYGLALMIGLVAVVPTSEQSLGKRRIQVSPLRPRQTYLMLEQPRLVRS